nr:maleylpyruvate isomerase N-terminal domain-containing protein [Streptomyces sp. NBC_00830]
MTGSSTARKVTARDRDHRHRSRGHRSSRRRCPRLRARIGAGLDSLTRLQAREPSALPGWSRGHVITHLARRKGCRPCPPGREEHGRRPTDGPGEQKTALT